MRSTRPAIAALIALVLVVGCGNGESPPAAKPAATPTPTPPPTAPPPPTKVSDCTGVPDIVPCVHPCGNGVCQRGSCVGECTPSATATPSRSETPTCAPTLGIVSCCAAHCEPCPTIRAGCNAQACQDCIERPVCDPLPTCFPLNVATPTPTPTPFPTNTCYTPATPIPDRTCSPDSCEFRGECYLSGHHGFCSDEFDRGCRCVLEGPTWTVTPQSCSTPTPTPICIATSFIPSCCAQHCDPCPTSYPGCNSEGCQDCIERPVCAPYPTCYPTANVIPSPTPTADCFENIGGCCDFRGQKPCYPLVYGADAAQCLNRDSGSPRGCHGLSVAT
jgi:hypothetical protein